MKKLLLIICYASISYGALAQDKRIDPVALQIFDRMSDFIGELQSCSYNLNVESDIVTDDKYYIKKFGFDEVYMSGPDKMFVNTFGLKGHRSYLYNGSLLAYYSHDENNYAVIEAQPTIMETISSINYNYDLEFPAADFFYPAFTDDLIATSSQIIYIGKSTINGTDCFQLVAIGPNYDSQYWISNDAYNLPMKFVITYKNEKDRPQYDATFSNWQVNPILPDAMFNFLPPPGSHQIAIKAKFEN